MKFSPYLPLGIGAILGGALPASAIYGNLRDIRVFVNDAENPPASIQPYKGFSSADKLGHNEVIDEVRLGYDLWQSILPDMNWRFEQSSYNSNMSITFQYFASGGGNNNFGNINIRGNGLAGRDIRYIDNRVVHSYTSWIFNPNAAHWKRLNGTGSCGTLPSVADPNDKWVFNESCINWSNNPVFSQLKGSDLTAIVQHEVGHSLMNPTNFLPYPDGQHGHLQPNGVTVNDVDLYWPTYQPGSAWMRRPIYDPQYLVRRRDNSFSAMWPGNGSDLHAVRGTFALDARQLANEGYRVTYPNISGAIVLRKGATGAFTVTSNWQEATNMMIWPTQGSPLSDAQAANMYFLEDVFPRSQTHKQFAAGDRHSLAIRENGSLWAWGANTVGQLGDGTTTSTATPKQISGDVWVSVTAGSDFSLGIKADGSLWAWGDNSHGQIGDGTSVNQWSPKRVGTANDWLSVSAGALHVIALKKTGRAYGWGYNGDAELGIGNTTTPVRSPSLVCPSTPSCQSAVFVSVSAGSNHSLALDMKGAAWGWGSNANQQLTINAGGMATVPVLISSIATEYRWAQLEAGHEHSSGFSNGSLYTWGRNEVNQLGNCATGGSTGWPTNICSADRDWASLFTGLWHTGGTKIDGRWSSWGYNPSGQLGIGSVGSTSSPSFANTSNDTWVQGAARANHTLGLLRDGTLWGWGKNSWGELGTAGPGVPELSPIKSKFTSNSLTASLTTYAASPTVTNINLTNTGTVNWSKWNSTSAPFQKATLAMEKDYKFLHPLGTYEKIPSNASINTFNNNVVKFSWSTSDEVGGGAGSNQGTGVSVGGTGAGRGFRLTIPARQAQRTLKVYVGAYRAQGKLVAKYSDGSVATYTNTSINSPSGASTQTNGMYAISFYSMNPGANLIVEWTVNAENTTSGSRYVSLQAATIN